MIDNTAPSFIFDGRGQITTDSNSYDNVARVVKVQADGKIVVAGYSFNGKTFDMAIVRYFSNGALDTKFGDNGTVTTSLSSADDAAYSVLLQDDGKIVVAGTSGSGRNAQFALVRYLSNGKLDTSFGQRGTVVTAIGNGDDEAYGAVLQANGKIIVVGASHNGHDYDIALVRYTTAGLVDKSFTGDGIYTLDLDNSLDGAQAVALQADGKVVVAGITDSQGSVDFVVLRYLANDSLDNSFGDGGQVITALGKSVDLATSLTIQADGKLLVGGISYKDGFAYFALVRYLSNGELDRSFSKDGIVMTELGDYDDEANSVIVQADGKILVAGVHYNGDDTDFAVVRYLANGQLDNAFGNNGIVITGLSTTKEQAYSLALQQDGKILVTGNIESNDNAADFALLRYNTNGTLDNSFGSLYDQTSLDHIAEYREGGNPVALDSEVRIYDLELAAQGHYSGTSLRIEQHGGGDSHDRYSGLGQLNLSQGKAVVNGVEIGTVYSTQTYLSIVFNSNATQKLINQALSSIAFSSTAQSLQNTITVDWLFDDGNDDYENEQGEGGPLTAAGSTLINVISSDNDAPHFGFLGAGRVVTREAFDDVVVQRDGKIVVAGGYGDFSVARYNSDGSLDKSFASNGIAHIQVDSALDNGRALALQDDGKIIVVGAIGGFETHSFAIMRLTRDGLLDRSFAQEGKTTVSLAYDSEAYDVAVQADGKIIVAGTAKFWFINADFIRVYYYGFGLARLNQNGSLDASFGGNGTVEMGYDPGSFKLAYTVTLQDDGKIIAAGWSGLGSSDFCLMRFLADGRLDASFGKQGVVSTGFDYRDQANDVLVQADGKILVVGSTETHGGHSTIALARYQANGQLDRSFADDGRLITAFGKLPATRGEAIAVQKDGKILVIGSWVEGGDFISGGNEDIVLMRYQADGRLDKSFSGDGKVLTDFTENDGAYSLALQDDGKIVVIGSDLVRYNSDGSLDQTFGNYALLDGVARYHLHGKAVVLDNSVHIEDPELAAQGHYAGATITLSRHGGANPGDVFTESGKLDFNNGQALLAGVQIGVVDNANGTLTITFNQQATQFRVDTALSSLAYRYTGEQLPATFNIDWFFKDGNHSNQQGDGGVLSATGMTTVQILPELAPVTLLGISAVV